MLLMKKLTFLFQVLFICWTIFGGGVVGATADLASKPDLSNAQDAYNQEKFQKVLDLIAPLLTADPQLQAARRLKMLSLARMGKTADSMKEYDQLQEKPGRDNEELLRQVSIAIILPFRSDMREQVRGAAYSALKEINSNSVVPYLEEGLADGSGMVRALVAEGLGRLSKGRASEKFHQALNDKAGWVRATVLKALGRSGDKTWIPQISPFLQDDQAVVQVTAAGALIMLGKRENWVRVEQASGSEEGYERGVAVRLLGELQDSRALPKLIQTLTDPQPTIRVAAAAALGKLGQPDAVPALVEVLSKGIPSLRSTAAVSLGKLNAEKAIPALKKALNDSDPGVQAAVVDALLRLNTPFTVVGPRIQSLMRHKNPGVRSGAARALGNGRSRDVLGALGLLLKDPVPRPRIAAARSLGRVGGREVMPQLKRALRDQDEAVRATAAGALARILSEPATT